MSHDLSHSQGKLLGFQIYALSHDILLIKSSLHLDLHLSLFHICLLLQTAEVNLHIHLQVLCDIIYLVSLLLDIKLNTLIFVFLMISGRHNLAYGSLTLLQRPLHLFTLIL